MEKHKSSYNNNGMHLHGMMNLNYQMVRILYQIFKIGKRLSNKYGQKLLDSTKKSTADAIKKA